MTPGSIQGNILDAKNSSQDWLHVRQVPYLLNKPSYPSFDIPLRKIDSIIESESESEIIYYLQHICVLSKLKCLPAAITK